MFSSRLRKLPRDSPIESSIVRLPVVLERHRAPLERIQQVAEVKLSKGADRFVGHQAALVAGLLVGVASAGDSSVFSSSPVSADRICTTTAVTLSSPPR